MIFYYIVMKEIRICLFSQIENWAVWTNCVCCFWHSLYCIVTENVDDIHCNWIINWNNFTSADTVYYYIITIIITESNSIVGSRS